MVEILEDFNGPQPKSNKILYISLAVIIVILTALLSLKLCSTPQPMTLNDLHDLNIKGGLPEEKGYMYNGFSFVEFDGLWYTKVQLRGNIYRIPLHYGPKDLDGIEIAGQLNENFNEGKVYISFNPYANDMKFVLLSVSEMGHNLAQAIGKGFMVVCDRNETSECQDRPAMNCSNTDAPVIYMSNTPGEAKIKLRGNCIELIGNEYELVKASERLIYQWYKIMD